MKIENNILKYYLQNVYFCKNRFYSETDSGSPYDI